MVYGNITFLLRRNATVAFSPIPIALSVCRLSVCRVMYCDQTVQDRPMVCIEVEYECWDEISIGTIFDPLGQPQPPKWGVELGGGS